MRLQHLDLIRYGKFTDKSIDIPVGKLDFHLFVGDNEAGKSTVRNAITDLLFGIEPRSRFNFLHHHNEMCLGAVIHEGSNEIKFQRVKKNKQSLTDKNGVALAEDLLASCCGHMDRSSFERDFCLNHAKLVKGGQNILNAKDDVGQMLFEASAGLGAFGFFRDRLNSEAKNLWTKRKSDSLYYKALADFNEAKRSLKDFTVRAKVWKQENKNVKEAVDAWNNAINKYRDLELERNRLERIRRVAPHLQTLQRKLQEKASLGEIVVLPESASEELSHAEIDLVKIEKSLEKCQAFIANKTEEKNAIVIDETILGHEKQIIDLEEQRLKVKDYPGDIVKREAEAKIIRDAIENTIRQLGWGGVNIEHLKNHIPSQIVQADIKDLLQKHGRLEEALSNTIDAVKEQGIDCDNLQEKIPEIPDNVSPTQLQAVLADAQSFGIIEEKKAELQAAISEASLGLNHKIKNNLTPWSGTIEELQELVIPDEESVQNLQKCEQDIINIINENQEEIEDTNKKLKTLQLKKSQFQNTQNPVTQEEIARLRKTRDDLWGQIKNGDKTLLEEPLEYENSIAKADEGADHRYHRAADVHKLETYHNDIEELQLSLQGLEQTAEINNAGYDKTRTEINEILGKLGLSGLETSAFLKWVQHTKEALDLYLSLTDAERRLAHLEAKETSMTSKLRKVLVDSGHASAKTSSFSLNGLTTLTNELILEAQSSKTKKIDLQEAITKANRKLVSLQKKEEKATSDMEQWNARWRKQILKANLSEDISVSGAQSALELITKLVADFEKLQDLRISRIEAMQHDLDDYKNMVTTITANITIKKNGLSTDQISIEFSNRLDKAKNDKVCLEKLLSELSKNNEIREGLISKKESVEANIKPLMTQAKAKAVGDLRIAISMSDKFRAIENDIKGAEQIILDYGDGLPLKELETEIENEDLKTIAVRLNENSKKLNEAGATRDDCLLRKKEAEDNRSKIHGQADAADAESKRQEALSTMANHTQRYIKIFVAEQLLKWSIDRFREEKQGPLLQRASAIFSMLTLGSFEKLTVDFESDDLQLIGRRPNGQHVDFEGLSDGTGDQLYLALRLAAVELQLQSMQALPFIADDLFINYDDKRSAAGFQALAELATKAQVIFFTHHDHLIEVARNAVGSKLNIIQL